MQPPTFRLEVRLRNNRLLQARARLGYKSAAETARSLGLEYITLLRYEEFSLSPLPTKGGWKESALKVAAAYYQDPEDLWPAEALKVSKARASLELSMNEIAPLLNGTPEARMMLMETSQELQQAFSKLNPREQEILEARVLQDEDLEVVGNRIGRSRERVRQIELQALRKLKKEMGER